MSGFAWPFGALALYHVFANRYIYPDKNYIIKASNLDLIDIKITPPSLVTLNNALEQLRRELAIPIISTTNGNNIGRFIHKGPISIKLLISL